jgi:ABC-type bacteriocin/lantibiotic exporter with double-glycine peptidase domain
LIKLLLGFGKPQEGAVYYDGRDINTLDLPSLRSHIGVVLQNGKLFSGDILSNITIMDNTITEEQVWRAAEIAGIADDIRKMPMGLHTHISEGSGGISGGQRQRIMIARALVSNPSVLIFDEAMSALDYLTQKKVSESLEKLNCTRIIVAHRLSTIRQCDRIFVLDGGRIAEEGTFDELSANGRLFATLIKRQQL